MTGDCSIFNPVLLQYLPIYKTILSGIFSHAYFKRKVFFYQISEEKSAAYYIRARAIVRQIRYHASSLDIKFIGGDQKHHRNGKAYQASQTCF